MPVDNLVTLVAEGRRIGQSDGSQRGEYGLSRIIDEVFGGLLSRLVS